VRTSIRSRGRTQNGKKKKMGMAEIKETLNSLRKKGKDERGVNHRPTASTRQKRRGWGERKQNEWKGGG